MSLIPAGPAEGQPDNPSTLTAKAESYLIETCGLPPELLPSSLSGPLHHVSRQLRTMALRRARLVQRLNVAAEALTGAGLRLMADTRLPGTPSLQSPDPYDVHAVAAVTGKVTELDEQLREWTAALRKMAVGMPAADWTPESNPRSVDHMRQNR